MKFCLTKKYCVSLLPLLLVLFSIGNSDLNAYADKPLILVGSGSGGQTGGASGGSNSSGNNKQDRSR